MPDEQGRAGEPRRRLSHTQEAEERYRKAGSPSLADAQRGVGLSHFKLKDCQATRKWLELLNLTNDPQGSYALALCLATSEPRDLKLARRHADRARALGAEIPDDVRRILETSD